MPDLPYLDGEDDAQAFDEAMFDDDSGISAEARSFEELPDVLDLTQVEGDRDEDEALALDADEFDEDAMGDADIEEDNELDYRAATEERQDDLDGLGPEDGFDDTRITRGEIDGQEEVRNADEAKGGEDDFTDFQARNLDDDDLKNLGYAEDRDGEVRAKPDR